MVLDAVIITIMIVFAYVGYRRGLVESLTRMAGFLLSLLFAYLFFPFIFSFIQHTPLYQNILEWIHTQVFPMKDTMVQSLDFGVLNGVLMPKVEQTAGNAAAQVSMGITNFIVMLLVFLLIRTAIVFILKAMHVVVRLPILNIINKMGGFVLGVVYGLLINILMLYTIGVFMPQNPWLQKESDDSFLYQQWEQRKQP